jgi:gamma-glutamylcyclotransferase (GGCT)/AIG2-like uncharacterized protein YtfP
MTLYFAYGSNLDSEQMFCRCPSAQLVGPGQLDGYRLAFAGRSAAWGGGVATVMRDRDRCVDGLVWEISAEDLAELDRYEGHPFSYARKRLLVWLDGRRRQVQVYIKPAPQMTRPSGEYFQVLSDAYSRHGFDAKALRRAAGGAR